MSEKWSLMTGYGGRVTFGCVVEYLLSAVRWVLLIGFSLFVATFTILRIPTETITSNISTNENMPLRIVTLLGALYIVTLIVSLVCRLLRMLLGQDARLRIPFLSQLFLGKNFQLIKAIRRLAFWGTISFLVLTVGLGADVNEILNSTKAPVSIQDYFSGYLSWSMLMVVVTIVLAIGHMVFYFPHAGEGAYSIFTLIGKDIAGSFVATAKKFITWVPAKGQDGKIGVWKLIKFILGRVAFVAYIVFMVLGIISMI